MNYNLLEEKWIPVLWKDGHKRAIAWAFLRRSMKQPGFVKSPPAIPWTAWPSCVSCWRCFIGAREIPRTTRTRSPRFRRIGSRNSMTIRVVSTFWAMESGSISARLSGKKTFRRLLDARGAHWHKLVALPAFDGHEGRIVSACCAAGLLRLPLFATSGGKGKPPGINQKPPSLRRTSRRLAPAETLCLSWRKVPDRTWEHPHGKSPT